MADGTIRCIGISMFGLIDLENDCLRAVPRPDWLGAQPAPTKDGIAPPVIDFRTLFKGFPVRLYVGHDSSTAAVGEWWKLKQINASFAPALFVRVRVGIGVGVAVVGRNGVERVGRSHLEAGHLPVVRRDGDPRGTCVMHSKEKWDCIEGVASEQAILARCKGARRLIDIPSNHVVWNAVADYMAQLCVAITTLIAPDMIVIGGRTMIDGADRPRTQVLEKIQDTFQHMRGHYTKVL